MEQVLSGTHSAIIFVKITTFLYPTESYALIQSRGETFKTSIGITVTHVKCTTPSVSVQSVPKSATRVTQCPMPSTLPSFVTVAQKTTKLKVVALVRKKS